MMRLHGSARRMVSRVAVWLFILLAPVMVPQAGETTGTITGVVTQATAPAAGAQVEARGTAGIFSTRCDAAGRFRLMLLPPGRYALTVCAPGSPARYTGAVHIEAGQTLEQTLSLKAFDWGTADEADDSTAANGMQFGEGEGGEDEGESPGEVEHHFSGGSQNLFVRAPPPSPAEFQASSAAGGASRFFPALLPLPGELHGRLNMDYSPRGLEGRRNPLSRSGLGGIANHAGTDRWAAAVEVSGMLRRDRLYFNLGYAPAWQAPHYRVAVNADDLTRDGVAAPAATQEYAGALRRTDQYHLDLTWLATERQRFTLSVQGAPQHGDGALRSAGRRVNGENLPGFSAATAPDAGVRGRISKQDDSASLNYIALLGAQTTLEASLAWRREGDDETPGAGADGVRYVDIRREQIYALQTLNGFAPIVSPAQYSTGGLGYFENGGVSLARGLGIKLSRNFAAAGSHALSGGLQLEERLMRENILNSGPRGAAGPGVYLFYTTRTGRFDDSFIHVRSGATAEISCVNVNPLGTDIAAACPNPRYSLVRGNINPVAGFTRLREASAFIEDSWQAHDLVVNAGLRYTRSRLANPDDYTLRNALNGNLLIGADGFPVGSRDTPIVTGGGETDAPDGSPNYIAGPGQFVGGSRRFPGEWLPRISLFWNVGGSPGRRLFAQYGRFLDIIPDRLARYAFNDEFGLARAGFLNPDFTGQLPDPTTFGGGYHYVQAGTRRGAREQLRLGFVFSPAEGIRAAIETRASRQLRVLAETQSAPLEQAINFFYDPYVVRGYCQNCAPRQVVLFPDYPVDSYIPPPKFMAETLANPGANTAAGLFGAPRRIEESIGIALRQEAEPGENWSGWLNARLTRARGNYEGMIYQDNGSGETRITSPFAYPLSGLTRTQYADGPLDPTDPTSLELGINWQSPSRRGLSAALSWRWVQGTLRTPMIANPVSPYAGLMPGRNPRYFDFVLSSYGFVSRQILQGYEAVERGALGRNPALSRWDLRLAYLHPMTRGALALSFAIDNLLNRTPLLRFDDAVETALGYSEPFAQALAAAPSLPRPLTATDSTRILNPAFGLPVAAQNPRTARLGVMWSF